MPNLARTVVRDSLRAQEYEPMIITAAPHTLELAEQIALEAYKVGADPAIFLDTDAVFYGQFKWLTEEQLRKTSAHCLGLLDYVKSYVWLGGTEDPAPMRRVPQPRWAAMFQGEDAHYRKSQQKKPKSVGLALALVTRPRAKAYGFNFNAWKKMTESAIAVNYAEMRRRGDAVASLLGRPGEVRVTAENGTDLTFRLAGELRKPQFDDGVIDDADVAAGDVETGLPAGTASVAPVEDSANGTFVSDVKIPQVGTLIEGLSWTFASGRVVDFSAKRNVKSAQLNWPEGTGAKDMLGSFSIGLNRKALPGFLISHLARGTVTLGIGDNQSLGGKNESSYGFAGFLSQGTVEVDGRAIVRDGRLAV